ncbi:MAG: hypothetical protein WC712_07220 [Candidatus Brocadiia bacterium]
MLPLQLEVHGFAVAPDEQSAYLHGWSRQVLQIAIPSLVPLKVFPYGAAVERVLPAGSRMLVVTEIDLNEIADGVSRFLAALPVKVPFHDGTVEAIASLETPLLVLNGRLFWIATVIRPGVDARWAMVSTSLALDDAIEESCPDDVEGSDLRYVAWFPGNERAIWGYDPFSDPEVHEEDEGETDKVYWELGPEGWTSHKAIGCLFVSKCPDVAGSARERGITTDCAYVPSSGEYALCYSFSGHALGTWANVGGKFAPPVNTAFCALRGSRIYYVTPWKNTAGYCDFGANPVERKLDFKPVYCDDRVEVASEKGGCSLSIDGGPMVQVHCPQVWAASVEGDTLFLLGSMYLGGTGVLVSTFSLSRQREIPLPKGSNYLYGANSSAAVYGTCNFDDRKSVPENRLLFSEDGTDCYLSPTEVGIGRRTEKEFEGMVTDRAVYVIRHPRAGVEFGDVFPVKYSRKERHAEMLAALDKPIVNVWEDLWLDLDCKVPVLTDSQGNEYALPPLANIFNNEYPIVYVMSMLRNHLFRQDGEIYLLLGLNAVKLTPSPARSPAEKK